MLVLWVVVQEVVLLQVLLLLRCWGLGVEHPVRYDTGARGWRGEGCGGQGVWVL